MTSQPTKQRRGLVKLSSRPDLVAQLHPEKAANVDPDTVSIGSHAKVWWACPAGEDHQWEAVVYSRAGGMGCPFCSGKRVSATNALSSTHPALAQQMRAAATLNARATPESVTAGSKRSVWWACHEHPDHVWSAAVYSRTTHNTGCPFCAGQAACSSNSLAAVDPALAAEFDAAHPGNGGATPETLTRGSRRLAYWRCLVDPTHSWAAKVYSRSSGIGCPYCSGRRATPQTCLATARPDLARQLDPAQPADGVSAETLTPHSDRRVWWRCDLGHRWPATVGSRSAGNGCPTCSGYLASSENNLLARFPEIAAQFDSAHHANAGLDPKTLTPTSSKAVWWRCPRGSDHSWSAKVGTRTNAGQGCPFCAGKRPSETNSLAALYPQVAAELDCEAIPGLSADQVVARSNKKLSWRCSTNPQHRWKAPVYSRTLTGNGCPECRLVAHSALEIRLACELAASLPVDLEMHRVLGKLRTWNVDVASSALRLVVEYDGSYWHRGKESVDLTKTKDLEAGGWVVVRVRSNLEPLSGNDVVVSDRDSTHTVASAVLDRLAQMGFVPSGLARSYRAGGVTVASDRADERIERLRGARMK